MGALSNLDGASESLDRREALAREVLNQVAGRWTFAVVCALARAGSPIRFSVLQTQLRGVTQKVLTTKLRQLERDGFIDRRIYPEVPPRVDYRLTDLGRDLFSQVDALFDWAEDRSPDFDASRRQFAAKAPGLLDEAPPSVA